MRRPPRSTPAAAPKPPTAPQTPSAMFRSRPSAKVVIRIASAAGEIVAAPRPWMRASADQRGLGPREPAEERADRERDQADHEDAAAAEQVRGPAAKQQEAAEDERVRGDDPLQVGLREAEIRLDRRKGDVHDRDVEHDHELDGAEQRQSEPFQSRRCDHCAILSQGVLVNLQDILAKASHPGECKSMKRYDQYCPIACSLGLVGERWTLLVVRELITGRSATPTSSTVCPASARTSSPPGSRSSRQPGWSKDASCRRLRPRASTS